MKNKPTYKKWHLWLAFFVVFFTLVYVLKSVLLPFVVGIIIGYLLDPLTTKLEKLKINRTFATILVLISVVAVVVPCIMLLIGAIQEQIGKFISVAPDYAVAFIKKIEPHLLDLQDKFPNLSIEKFREYLRENAANSLKIIGALLKKIISGGMAVFNLLSLLLVTPIVAFYMLRDWKSFTAKVDGLLPVESKERIRILAKQVDDVLAGFIRGQLSVCVLLGAFYSLGLYFVGLELGLLIGFIAGLLSFIPYVGTITGFVVSICMALAQFDTATPVLYVCIVFALGQFIEGNFLTPNLVGDKIGLHPVWIIFALLTGGYLLGFLGLLIAVPFAGILGVLIRYSITEYKKSNLYLGS